MFDVRTAISNPNRQICFQELDNNSCKMLFSKRTKPLNYNNRFEYSPMRVMSEKEQSKEIDNFGEKKDVTTTTTDGGGGEENVNNEDSSNNYCGGRGDSSSSSNESSGDEVEKIKQDRNVFNGGEQATNNFLNSKVDKNKEKKTSQPGFFTEKQKVEQKEEEGRGVRKRKLSIESDSNDSDSTVILSDEDKMYSYPRKSEKEIV